MDRNERRVRAAEPSPTEPSRPKVVVEGEGASASRPHLRGQPGATLVNISSGLALVPLALFPVCCATMATVHSFTMLRDTGVMVAELLPPYVATELDQAHKEMVPAGVDPMPLEAVIAETMKALEGGADEVAIGLRRMTGRRPATGCGRCSRR